MLIGSEMIAPKALLDKNNAINSFILYDLRLPRAITALLVGVGLSVSGLLMQSLFRNALAGPYVLGISSGAGLGVAIMLMSGGLLGFTLFSSWTLVLAAIFGTLMVLMVILSFSLHIRQSTTLLIIGIMIGTFVSAIISVFQYFTDAESLKKFVLWTFGSTSSTSMNQVYVLLFCVLLGLVMALLSSKQLNAFLMGEDYAKSLGVSVKTTRLISILTVGLLAGAITAFCGPIAFVGLAVPHIARGLFKTSVHQVLLPASALIGGGFMLLCDMLSQVPFLPYTLPINAITSLLGAPIVIYVIVRKRGFVS